MKAAAALEHGECQFLYPLRHSTSDPTPLVVTGLWQRVTGTIELEDPDPSRWRAQLCSLLERMRRALVDRPGIAALTLADPPTTDAVLRLAENLLASCSPPDSTPEEPLGFRHLRVVGDGHRPRGRSARPARPKRRRPPRAG